MVSLIRSLEHKAVEKYKECPKYITIVRHADLEDDSEFFCVLAAPFVGPSLPGVSEQNRQNFIVPKQNVINFEDSDIGKFVIVRVIDEDTTERWLVASVRSRIGFILPIDELPDCLLREELYM